MLTRMRRSNPFPPPGHRFFAWEAAILLGVAGPLSSAWGGRQELLSLVPADAAAVVTLNRRAPSEPSMGLQMGVIASQLAAQIGQEVDRLVGSDQGETLRVWTDLAGTLLDVFEYPSAFVVLDVESRSRFADSYQLDRANVALILETGGDEGKALKRIQQLLGAHANNEDGSVRRVTRGPYQFYHFRDRRLPEWAKITWGSLGDRYLVTLGPDADERILACLENPEKSLAQHPWFVAASRACRRPGVETSFYVNFDRLRRDQPAGFLARLDATLATLQLTGTERLYGVISKDGRVVESSLYLRRDGEDQWINVADHAFLEEWGYDLIPQDASSFSVIDGRFSTLPLDIWKGYLSTQNAEASHALEAVVNQFETQAKISLARDVFAHLGDRVILYDYPPPLVPLGLPGPTLLIPIKEDASGVKRRLELFLTYLAQRLDRASSTRFALRRAEDGTWSLDWGLEGPALKVHGRWIILSYSPRAVKLNVAHLNAFEASR